MKDDLRVLAAIDASDGADAALREWSAISARANSRGAVVYVAPRAEDGSFAFPKAHEHDDSPRMRELRERAREAVGARVSAVRDGDVEIFIDEGLSYAEIVKRAERWHADMIVIGGYGQSRLARAFGSVAERVVRYAHCPVLIARAGGGHGGVLVGTDLSPVSLEAVIAGAKEARYRGTLLKVVHAVGFLELEAAFRIGHTTSGMTRDVGHLAFTGALEGAVTALGVTAKCEILEGSPAAAIIREATTMDAELVVVGNYGKAGIARILLGSVAEKVARSAPCSALVVRASQISSE